MMDSCISSAFWFAGREPDGTWTEIDVFEYSTSTNNRNWATWYNTNAHVHHLANVHLEERVSRPAFFDMEVNLSAEAHKYALEWTQDHIAWYFDDREIRRIENKYWHYPLHLQFDSETMPGWWGTPETGGQHKNNLPNCFEVYYVRSWKRYV